MRQLKIQKKFPNGKIRRYKNLATFHDECPVGFSSRKNFCAVTNTRKLRDGSGMATVVSRPYTNMSGRKRGVWLLHYASHDVMMRQLKKRGLR